VGVGAFLEHGCVRNILNGLDTFSEIFVQKDSVSLIMLCTCVPFDLCVSGHENCAAGGATPVLHCVVRTWTCALTECNDTVI
jgi:hypothetical protein